MVRASVIAIALLVSFGTNDAQAAGWSDFRSAFPPFHVRMGGWRARWMVRSLALT